MQKLTLASLFLFALVMIETSAFAASYKCEFKDQEIEGVDSIEMTDGTLIINNQLNIAVEESRIRCANFGKRKRFDGEGEGLQVVLKTCTSEAAVEGYLINPKTSKAAEVLCDEM